MEKRPKGQTWYTKEEEQQIYGEPLKDNFRGDRRTNLIYFIKQVDKQSFKIPCKTNSPAKAYKFAPGELKRRLTNPEQESISVDLISEELYKFEQKKMSEVKDSTSEIIARSLQRIREFYGDDLPIIFDDPEWTEKSYMEFLDWHQKAYPGQGMFNIIKYLRAFLNYLHRKGAIRKLPAVPNPFLRAEEREAKKRKQRIFSEDEIKRLLSSARSYSVKDELIIELGYYLAFRISDSLTLKWSMINFDPNDPYIQFSGDDKEETFISVPIPKCILEKLSQLKTDPPESEYVFPRKQNSAEPMSWKIYSFKDICKRAKVDHGTYHTLRHTRLTLDFGNPKIPQAHVLKFRRVSLQVALEHYIHLTQDDRKSLLKNMTGLL